MKYALLCNMKLSELRFSQFHMQTFPPPAENTSCNEVHFWEVSKQLPLLGHVFRVTQDHNIHQVGIPGNLDSSFLKDILKILVGNPCVTTQSLLTWPDIWGSEGHDEVFKSQHWTFLVGDHSDDHVVTEVLLGHLRWIIETQDDSRWKLKLFPPTCSPSRVHLSRFWFGDQWKAPVVSSISFSSPPGKSKWWQPVNLLQLSNSPGRAPEPSTWSALSNRSG